MILPHPGEVRHYRLVIIQSLLKLALRLTVGGIRTRYRRGRCDGVTNFFFTQLTALKAPFLITMTIQDCPGFTSSHICSFLIARRGADIPVTKVVVSGKGPPLTVDTSRWIQRQSHCLKVKWNVERDNTFAWHDISNLRPLTTENKPWDVE